MFASKDAIFAKSSGGYQITNSLRFRSSASAYLSRTPASAGNRTTWTWSGWVKRGALSNGNLFHAPNTTSGTAHTWCAFSSDSINFYDYTGSAYNFQKTTTQVLRDPSAWYHLIFVVDSNNGTAQNRARIYINGVEITAWSTNTTGSSGFSTAWNNNILNQISSQSGYLDGYLAEVNFIDCPSLVGSTTSGSSTITLSSGSTANIQVGWNIGGTNIPSGATVSSITNSTTFVISANATATGSSITFGATPPVTAFGQFDATTGVWTPKAYTGTYGTNGFYLPFNSNTSAETLAYDLSNRNPELISNGMFVSNVTGWTAAGSGSPSVTWQSAHTMRVANSANNAPWAYTTISTVIGQTYYAQAYISAASIGGTSRNITFYKADDANYSVNAVNLSSTTQGAVPAGLQGTFTATATTTYIIIFADVIGSGTTGVDVSQVSVALGAYKKSWNPFNISVTSGTTYDSMIDSPTNYADGGNGRGNYCVMNPLNKTAAVTVSDGNLAVSGTTYDQRAIGTLGVTSGKWYFEITPTAGSAGVAYIVGVCNQLYLPNVAFPTSNSWSYSASSGNKYNGSGIAYGNTWATNDVIGVAVDMDNGKIWFSKNGTWQASGDPAAGTNAAFTNLSGNTIFPLIEFESSAVNWTQVANFGQRGFSQSVPSGFKALNTQNLPTPTIAAGNKYFDATTYTGNGSTQNISNSGNFQPDMVWVKNRGSAYNNVLYDAIRGLNALYTDLTSAENAPGGVLTGFLSNGFSVGSNPTVNESAKGIVGWQWNAGGSTVTGTGTGGITNVSYRANPTAGFSVVTYTGAATAGTITHGLNATPAFIMVKDRSSATNGGAVYHTSLGATQYLKLFQTTTGTDGFATDNTVWNGAAPTFSSTVFSVGTNARTNSTDNYVAYCFAPVAGYSAMGSYTGNGASTTDGPFTYLGFRPRFLLVKRSDSTGSWLMFDSSRDTYNPDANYLIANSSAAEAASGVPPFDFLSNGFKCRATVGAWPELNTSGATIIYAAFAENPFAISRAR